LITAIDSKIGGTHSFLDISSIIYYSINISPLRFH